MAEVSVHSGEIDGLPVVWRSAPGPDPSARQTGASPEQTAAPPDPATPPPEQPAAPSPTPLYVHGVPNSSALWTPFLEHGGGVAPDLPGFGRSGKPGNFDYTIDGYADFLERFTELAGLDRVSLAVHDWGAVGLAFAQRHPERVARLAVIDAVPLLPGYRWHRIARVWRTPVLGELAMGATSARVLRFISREANATPGPLPDEFLEEVLADFDHGTQRAILRLYRSADPAVLADAGSRLGEVRAPALVVWGERDPYLPTRFADDYARALDGAEVHKLPDAGHWPWLDRPDVVARVADHLAAP